MKKYFSVCLIAVFLIFSSAVAMAMPASNPVLVEQQSELPSWLTEAGAQTIPDVELATVQGEIVVGWAIVAGAWIAVIAYAHYEFIQYARTGRPISPASKRILTGACEIPQYFVK